MKLLYTVGLMALIISGCTTTLKNSSAVIAPPMPPSPEQANVEPTIYEYIVLADGTLLVSPSRRDAKHNRFSNPVISNVRINAEYR
jgi:hypothetical protein